MQDIWNTVNGPTHLKDRVISGIKCFFLRNRKFTQKGTFIYLLLLPTYFGCNCANLDQIILKIWEILTKIFEIEIVCHIHIQKIVKPSVVVRAAGQLIHTSQLWCCSHSDAVDCMCVSDLAASTPAAAGVQGEQLVLQTWVLALFTMRERRQVYN